MTTSSKDVPKNMPKYDYLIWCVLEEEAPDEMREDLGRMFGFGHVFGGSMKIRQGRRKCPKCGKYYVGYPVLLREVNKTGICPGCGIREAVEAYGINLRASSR